MNTLKNIAAQAGLLAKFILTVLILLLLDDLHALSRHHSTWTKNCFNHTRFGLC